MDTFHWIWSWEQRTSGLGLLLYMILFHLPFFPGLNAHFLSPNFFCCVNVRTSIQGLVPFPYTHFPWEWWMTESRRSFGESQIGIYRDLPAMIRTFGFNVIIPDEGLLYFDDDERLKVFADARQNVIPPFPLNKNSIYLNSKSQKLLFLIVEFIVVSCRWLIIYKLYFLYRICITVLK